MTVQNVIARGNAPGHGQSKKNEALKGRNYLRDLKVISKMITQDNMLSMMCRGVPLWAPLKQ